MKQTPLKRIITIACGTVLFFLLGAFVSISSPIDTVNICVQYGLLAFLSVAFGPLTGSVTGLLGHICIDKSNLSKNQKCAKRYSRSSRKN